MVLDKDSLNLKWEWALHHFYIAPHYLEKYSFCFKSNTKCAFQTIIFTAFDGGVGENRRFGKTHVNITIDDVNNKVPSFNEDTLLPATIMENVGPGYFVRKIVSNPIPGLHCSVPHPKRHSFPPSLPLSLSLPPIEKPMLPPHVRVWNCGCKQVVVTTQAAHWMLTVRPVEIAL